MHTVATDCCVLTQLARGCALFIITATALLEVPARCAQPNMCSYLCPQHCHDPQCQDTGRDGHGKRKAVALRNIHYACVRVFLCTAGSGSVVRRAILDLNCRIGSNVRLVNAVSCSCCETCCCETSTCLTL